jgi:hypothetical protein
MATTSGEGEVASAMRTFGAFIFMLNVAVEI